jgi:hypothetical protein
VKRYLPLLFALPVLWTARALAVPDPTADELKANRAALEQWRKHPDQVARLRRDLKAFLALSADRQEQILKLDRDLQEEATVVQARLTNVLERYARWIERLPEADQQAIQKLPDNKARIALIRTLRDNEWMRRSQPSAKYDEWTKLGEAERATILRKLREEDRKRRAEWQLASRFWTELESKQWLPVRVSDLTPADNLGVKQYLLPFLSPEEKVRLNKAEGNWPDFPRTLLELADRHPLAFPPLNGPTEFKEMPRDVQNRVPLSKLIRWPDSRKWPDFGAFILAKVRSNKQTPLSYEFWAWNDECLRDPMQKYLALTLRPVLTPEEHEKLKNAKGKWPDYPLTIHALALAHELAPPPWQTALLDDGDPTRWAKYRDNGASEMPLVSNKALSDFVLYKLTPQERSDLKLNLNDPHSWKHVEELLKKFSNDLNRFPRPDQKKGHFPFPPFGPKG